MEINEKQITLGNNNTETVPTKFEIHKKRYEKFQKDMEKSDLGQGYTRYIQELYLLETLGKCAIEENNPDHIKFVRDNAIRVSKKLEDSFGIIIKNKTLDNL